MNVTGIRSFMACAVGCVLLLGTGQVVHAQFTTVINAPPDVVPTTIGSSTQLNLFNGGSTLNDFKAGAPDGTSMNVEVNVLGGLIRAGSIGYPGSTINMTSGRIHPGFSVHGGSVLNVSGGLVWDGLRALAGSQVNLLPGGEIEDDFIVSAGSVVNISGGRIGSRFESSGEVNLSGGAISGFNAGLRSGSVFNMSGGGLPEGIVAGIGSVMNISGGTIASPSSTSQLFTAGSGSQINVTGGRFGNRISFNLGSNSQIGGGTFGDRFIMSGTTTISGGEFLLNGVPIGDTSNLDLPDAWTLSGVFANGTPFVFSNKEDNLSGIGSLERDFIRDMALSLNVVPLPDIGPATINLPVDAAPLGLRAGQTANIGAGGSLSDNYTAGAGSTVVLNGGAIGRNFEAFNSQIDVVAGFINERFDAFEGTVVNLHDGRIDEDFELLDGSTLNALGGFIDRRFRVYDGSTVNASGARFIGETTVRSGGVFNLSGGTTGNSLTTDPLSSLNIYGGEFYLDGSPLNVVGSMPLNVPANAVLSGTLADGTPFAYQSPDGVTPGETFANGTLTLIAQTLPPINPTVITSPPDAIPLGIRNGQTLNLNGGNVSPKFNAGRGSTLNFNGGLINSLDALDADVNVMSGVIQVLDAFENTAVTVTGGNIASMNLRGGSDLTISGGGVLNGRLAAFPGSEVHLFGSAFYLDDVLIPDLTDIGDTMIVTTRGGAVLTGFLTDGRTIRFHLTEQFGPGDYFDTDALLRLTIADSLPPREVPEPSAIVLTSIAYLFFARTRIAGRIRVIERR